MQDYKAFARRMYLKCMYFVGLKHSNPSLLCKIRVGTLHSTISYIRILNWRVRLQITQIKISRPQHNFSLKEPKSLCVETKQKLKLQKGRQGSHTYCHGKKKVKIQDGPVQIKDLNTANYEWEVNNPALKCFSSSNMVSVLIAETFFLMFLLW